MADKKQGNWFGRHKILTGIIGFFLLVGIISAVSGDTDTSTSTSSTPASSETEQVAESEQAENEPAVPAEFRSALSKAKTYSDTMHMSKQGIYDQLTSEYGEQFSAEAGQYAIDNLEADYKANALAKAKTYQDTMSMSPAAIHDQLTSAAGEKFTVEEADYAIANL